MKKTYIIPQTSALRIRLTTPLAESQPDDVEVDENGSVDARNVDVKGSGSSYNVWKDDWRE